MSNILQVRNLSKAYKSGDQHLEVLIDLSLEVEKGEMVAVTGVSGSGKSTLLHLLGGMDKPDTGSICISGQELSQLSALELARFRNSTIGFVFQFHHLLPEFTAMENVMMPLLLRGLPVARAIPAAQEAIEDVGLAQRAQHRPGELSGGEQQRVALARALVGNPSLLLADEPTGNLDPVTGESISALFRTLHERHQVTSLLVTHNEKLALMCSRSYHLTGGRLENV